MLLAAAVVAAGHGGPVVFADVANAFRLAIAVTVLPLGFLFGEAAAGEPLRPPFPVHIQALVGTVIVSWLFRLAGLAWLVLAVWHFAARA